MSRFIGREGIDGFRGAIARRLGLLFDESKLDYLTEIVNRRLEERRVTVRSYLDLLDSADGRDEVRALADVLTVAETYFFRYADHFRAFSDIILPDRMQARRLTRQLRLLSAGCASGEEPYSLAILVRDRLGADAASWAVRISAVDVSPAAIRRAGAARYSPWSLRETPPEIRQRYFQGDGREFSLDRSVREMVAFEERNLIEEDPVFWQPEAFDVVFCRNVTMYLAPDVTRALIARIARSMAPGGYLFLGHAETLRAISHDFHLRHTHDTFYYERRGRGEESAPVPVDESRSTAPPLDLPAPDAAWVDAIREASERIAALADRPGGPAPAPARPPDLSRAIEFVRQERFSDAIDALPLGAAANADAQLLRAVILTNSGDVREAQEVCGDLLRIDEFNAGAHYLMALCREHDRDLAGALSHDQTAIYLDAAFAMPHLHWGLMARRTADLATARRELALAADLLDREEPSRVLLFGGGFSREALVGLCHSELKACGGRP